MSNTGSFGWAYIGQGLGGPNGAIQYRNVNGLSGSSAFLYDSVTDAVTLSGSLEVSGSITANQFNVNVVNKTVSSIDVTGSTYFGDTTDDTHVFTGSLFLSGAADSDLDDSSEEIVATNPTLVVRGATVFDGPVQLAGIIHGASPVKFAADISITDDEGGEVVLGTSGWGGDLEISGTVTATSYVSGSAGIFEELTGTINASNFVGTIDNARLPSIIDVSTVTASSGITSPTAMFTSVSGTVIQASQPQITSLGTLTGLSVNGLITAGSLNVDSNTLFVSASNDRVGIGTITPRRTLDIRNTDGNQFRLTNQQTGFPMNEVYTDFSVDDAGGLTISPYSNGTVYVSGNLEVTGTIYANEVITNVVNKNVVHITATGSTTFGDTSDDRHNFIGAISASMHVSASTYYGDGSNLSGLAVTDLKQKAENRLVTIGATTTELEGESNLTFDGNQLDLSGSMKISGSILPNGNEMHDLGAPGVHWRNIYCGDFHLKNERGNWTIVEEEDYLSLRNNKTGKLYKFVLQEIIT